MKKNIQPKTINTRIILNNGSTYTKKIVVPKNNIKIESEFKINSLNQFYSNIKKFNKK